MQASEESQIIHTLTPKTPEQEASDRVRAHRLDVIALTAGGLALIALTYFVQSILSPFVLLLVLYVLVSPFREYIAARKLLAAGVVLFGLWFFITLFGLLIPFLLGAVLAYLFNPLVTLLKEKYQIHRTWSTLIIVLLFCTLLVVLGWLFIPSLIQQTQAFIARLSLYVKANANAIDEKHLRKILISLGLPPTFVDSTIMPQTGPEMRKELGQIPKMIFAMIAGLPKFVERTLNLVIVPIAMFYFLKDWPKIGVLVYDLLPKKNPARTLEVMTTIDTIVYSYVRGQATVAAIIGVLGAIAYSILGIPYAGLLGVILAVSDLIPIVGMLFSMFVVELVIFLTMELNAGVILSGILVIVGLHFLEVYIIGPRIVGEGIGIPPIIMILALLVFGYFLGFIGMLIAVPATAVIILFVNEYRKNQVEAAT